MCVYTILLVLVEIDVDVMGGGTIRNWLVLDCESIYIKCNGYGIALSVSNKPHMTPTRQRETYSDHLMGSSNDVIGFCIARLHQL